MLSQTQLGSEIFGQDSSRGFGVSNSLSGDGTRLAVGAYLSDKGGLERGLVSVFDFQNGDWTQVGNSILGESEGDEFGFSIALSNDGNVLAAGAIYNDGGHADAGHVRVFEWDNGSWIQRGQDIDGDSTDDQMGFGMALSEDGNILAVGAPGHILEDNIAGYVRVYAWQNNSWTQLGSTLEGETLGDLFGRYVSLSSDGKVLAVGIIGIGFGRFDYLVGQVRIYDWINGDWELRGAPVNGLTRSNYFGTDVKLSSDGNRFAAGAPFNDGAGDKAGQVRAFEWRDTAWFQLGEPIRGKAAEDWCGQDIAFSADGNRLVVGSHRSSEADRFAGQVRIFDWQDTAWIQIGADLNGIGEREFFGGSLSVSDDGTIFAAGATGRVNPLGGGSAAIAYSLTPITTGISPRQRVNTCCTN